MGAARRLLAPLVVAMAGLAAGIASCTNVSTSPAHVAALAFDTLPFPAVVTGDTLRDSTGVAAPLHAVAYGTNGTSIDGAFVQYILLDTGVTVGAGGVLTAQRRDGTVRIVASTGGLQSVARTLQVARRPDTVVVTGKLVDTVLYVVPDNSATNASKGLSLKLVTSDSADGVAVTRGWVVSYQAFYHGAALSPADTAAASLWNELSRVSTLDTTGADGSASRTLRIRPLGLTTAADSFVVVTTVRYKGAAVRGSPVRFVIHYRPKS